MLAFDMREVEGLTGSQVASLPLRNYALTLIEIAA